MVPIVDMDLWTMSRRQMTMRFVDFIPDPCGAFLYMGGGDRGGEPLCKPVCFEDIDFKSLWRRKGKLQKHHFGTQKLTSIATYFQLLIVKEKKQNNTYRT